MLLRLLQLKTLNECIVRLLELNAVADLEFHVQASIKSNCVCTRPEVGCNIHGVTALTRAKHLAKLLNYNDDTHNDTPYYIFLLCTYTA